MQRMRLVLSLTMTVQTDVPGQKISSSKDVQMIRTDTDWSLQTDVTSPIAQETILLVVMVKRGTVMPKHVLVRNTLIDLTCFVQSAQPERTQIRKFLAQGPFDGVCVVST